MFVCKSRTLANFLMENGLKCEKVDVDKVNSNFMVFLFRKSEEWDSLMKKWTELRNK